MIRTSIFITAIITFTVLVAPQNIHASEPVSASFEGHTFPALGYGYNALEPVIDAQTMELHYSKHYRGYYDKFIDAASTAGLLNTPLTGIFASISQYPESIRNNGGGYFNHTLFWQILTPEKKEISPSLKAAIEKEFGTCDQFRTLFETAAKNRFGSGWAWLSVDTNGRLFVSSTANQDNPLMDVVAQRGTPILALDVWEHAYYLKYQNRRAEYVGNFWKIVNWDVVDELFRKATLR